MIWYQINR